MSPFFRHIEKPYTQTNSPTKSVPLKNKRLQTPLLNSNLNDQRKISPIPYKFRKTIFQIPADILILIPGHTRNHHHILPHRLIIECLLCWYPICIQTPFQKQSASHAQKSPWFGQMCKRCAESVQPLSYIKKERQILRFDVQHLVHLQGLEPWAHWLREQAAGSSQFMEVSSHRYF